MARGKRKEAVTVSFHYLIRVIRDDDNEPVMTPLKSTDFHSAMSILQRLPEPNLTTREAVDDLRFGNTVPIYNLISLDQNTYFGTYKGVYSGHSYENTAKGLIPYDSVSLRRFYFLVYRSPVSGRVYIATQYLGQFGAYTELKNTIIKSFENRKGIESHSFRSSAQSFHKVRAKEIIIEYMKKGENRGQGNIFTQGPQTIVFKKSGSGDDFADATRSRLFSIFDGPKDQIKREVAKILREANLIAVSDNDILNCTVIADVAGSSKRYHFINDSNFATQFPILVGLTADGHPIEDQTRNAMINLLRDAIISRAENV